MNKPFSTTKAKKIPVLAIRIRAEEYVEWKHFENDMHKDYHLKWIVEYLPVNHEYHKISFLQRILGKKPEPKWVYYRTHKQEDVARAIADEIYTQGFVEVSEKTNEVWCHSTPFDPRGLTL